MTTFEDDYGGPDTKEQHAPRITGYCNRGPLSPLTGPPQSRGIAVSNIGDLYASRIRQKRKYEKKPKT